MQCKEQILMFVYNIICFTNIVQIDQIGIYVNSVSQLHNVADNYNRNMANKIRQHNEQDDEDTRDLLRKLVS